MSPIIGGFKSNLEPPGKGNWRDHWFHIIFEADTFAGKLFDLGLLVAILFYLVMNSLETVESVGPRYSQWFKIAEWTCTILFTIEYVMRIACVKRPWRYITSFYGIVDLLSILPTYCIFFLGSSAQSFGVIRALRLLRVFRVLKLGWLTSESEVLWQSVWDSRGKVVVFLFVVVVSVTIAGTLMYEIEGRHAGYINGNSSQTEKVDQKNGQSSVVDTVQESKTDQKASPDVCPECGRAHGKDPDSPQRLFDSIPSAIYWAIVTMTTVGYGDIVPKTVLGKFVASLLILLGYSLIIVPTGFVSAEISKKIEKPSENEDGCFCLRCPESIPGKGAKFCQTCGDRLEVRINK